MKTALLKNKLKMILSFKSIMLYLIKNKNIMNVENKIKDIIDMLEDAISFEDWGRVEDAQKELTFVFEEMQSSFPLDEWDEEGDL